jgi:hypothetical protein
MTAMGAEDAQDRRPARDRDPAGRARSQRPRDGLGRPLPHDAAGVARQPEGVRRTPAETLAEAGRLLAEGLPFHAHEVFEDAWKTGPAAERDLWRGLAQLAVGITHAARGNRTGAVALLHRGAEGVRPYAGSDPHGLDVTAVLRWAADAVAAVEHADGALRLPAPPL